jgi:hypothetical protein
MTILCLIDSCRFFVTAIACPFENGDKTGMIVGLRQKTNREKLQLQSPLGIYFEKPKIAETQIYQGKS